MFKGIEQLIIMINFCLIKRRYAYTTFYSLLFILFFFSFFINDPSEAVIDVADINMPEEFGKVVDTFQGASKDVVFLINDIHNNFEAQLSVAKVIDFLVNYYDIKLVGIEGARGTIDTASLKRYYDRKVKSSVCSYYVKQGYFGGAVYDAIVSDNNVMLRGLEDETLYSDIHGVYRDTFEERKAVLEQIDLLRGILSRFQKNMFSQELLDLEQSYNDYNANKLSLINFCNVLLQLCIKLDIKLTTYPNMMLLKDVKIIEDKIDFSLVSAEEEKLIDVLKKTIGKELNDLSLLNTSIQQVKTKKISEDEYYDIVHLLSKKYQISLNAFDNLWRVIKSSSVYRRVCSVKLYEEARVLYPLIQNKLLRTSSHKEAEELIVLLQSLDTLYQIVSLAASPGDVEDYYTNPEKYSSPRFIRFIRKHSLAFDVGYRINPKVVRIDKIRSLLERFYSLSHKRSDSLVEHLLGDMQKQQYHRAVLVAGTFHIDDIMRTLKKSDTSFVTINPYLSHVRGDIALEPVLLGAGDAIKTYLSPLAIHLKPWIALAPFRNSRNLSFRYLLKIEFVVQDVYSRIHSMQEQLTDRIVTREIYKLQNSLLMNNKDISITPHRILRLDILDKYFIEIAVEDKGKNIRLLVEPLEERERSYAEYAVSQIELLKNEQLERGIFGSNNRLMSVLKSDYQAEIYLYNERYLDEVKREIAEEQEARKKTEGLIQPQIPDFDKDALEDDFSPLMDKEAMQEKINEIARIVEHFQSESSLDMLSELQVKFLILKSQLSFYSLTQEMKTYIKSVENEMKAKIDETLRTFEEIEKAKKKQKEARQQQEEVERRLRDAQRLKERRKKIDAVMGEIYILKKKVDYADTLAILYEVENKFNMLIGTLLLSDLHKEDRVILNAFKVTWEAKYDALEEEQGKKEKERFKVIGEGRAASSGYLKQVFALKELVDAATLPADAEFILGEYNKLKGDSQFPGLAEEEKHIFNTIGDYIQKTLTDLKTGSHQARISLLRPEGTMGTRRVAEKSPSVESSFGKIYKIRNKAMMLKTVAELQTLENEFQHIDQNVRTHDLAQHQKAILADTERIIKESMRRLIIQAESKMEDDRRIKERRVQRERESLLKDLLGETKPDTELKKKIVFIEDNAFEKKIIIKRLEQEGYAIESLDDYAFPITLFSEDKVDLILLDDDIIGNKTGIDFIQTVKVSEKNMSLHLPPIIVHTNNSVSWAYDMLKRKGLTKKQGVFVTSKRDLNNTIALINELILQ